MKKNTMKKLTALACAGAMSLSLAACGEKRPSQEDVEQSIEAGTLTIEDALDKGWVDQAWVDAYYEENSVPAASKTVMKVCCRGWPRPVTRMGKTA